VDWSLRSQRVDALMCGEMSPPRDDGVDALRLDIPADFDAIRRADPSRAQAWRLRTREAFQRAFADGYEAVDFVQGAYVLRKNVSGARE